jgi:hypothetical protein
MGRYSFYMIMLLKYTERNRKNQLEASEKLSLAKSQRRKDFVLESICDSASLREPHFWDYSEVSTYIFSGAETPNTEQPLAMTILAIWQTASLACINSLLSPITRC